MRYKLFYNKLKKCKGKKFYNIFLQNFFLKILFLENFHMVKIVINHLNIYYNFS
jgi:hypothetical protein